MQLGFTWARGLGDWSIRLAFIKPNGGLKDNENIVTTSLNPGYDLRDVLGFRYGVIYSFAELLHKTFEILVHGILHASIRVRCSSEG
jgi:hypothetical protein